MRKLALVLFLCFNFVQAQFADWERPFVYSVKNVDEFFKRFNGDSTNIMATMFSKQFPDQQSFRKALLFTLFDQESDQLDSTMILEFVDKMNDQQRPQFLSFYDDNWYARLDCMVKYKGESEHLVLTLEVEKEPDYSSRWVIRGADAKFLDVPLEKNKQLKLNPASDETNFMGLKKLFSSDKSQIKGYLYRNFEMGKLALFIHELSAENIEFERIENISYHFLQMPEWAFVVQKSVEKYPNISWVISSLMKQGEKEKENYKKAILFLD